MQVEVDGVWQEFGTGFTVGHKRLLRGPLVEAQKVRVTITEALSMPVLTKISLYKTPSLSQKEVVQGLAFAEKKPICGKKERLFILGLNVAKVILLWRLRFRFSRGQVSMVSPIRTKFKSFNSKLGKQKDLCLPTLHFAADQTLDFYLNLTVDGQLVDQLQVQVS